MPKLSLIDTPCGRMTREHAGILAGLARNTISRRVWQGWPTEYLFVHFRKGSRVPFEHRGSVPPKAKRGKQKLYFNGDERNFIEPYSEFKRRKQQERANAKLHGHLHREAAERKLAS